MWAHVLRAGPGPPAAHLHCASCHMWRVAPQDPPMYQSAWWTWVLAPLWSQPKSSLEKLLQPTRYHWWLSQQEPWEICQWLSERLDPGWVKFPGSRDWPEKEQRQARSCWLDGNTCLPTVTWTWERCPSPNIRLSWLIRCLSKKMAHTKAKVLWDNFIVHYGLPEKILSDQGRNFESELITANLCKLTGTKKCQD